MGYVIGAIKILIDPFINWILSLGKAFPKIIVTNVSFGSSGSKAEGLKSLNIRFNIINCSKNGIYFKKIIINNPLFGDVELTKVYDHYPHVVSYLSPEMEMTLEGRI